MVWDREMKENHTGIKYDYFRTLIKATLGWSMDIIAADIEKWHWILDLNHRNVCGWCNF